MEGKSTIRAVLAMILAQIKLSKLALFDRPDMTEISTKVGASVDANPR
jgi:hypothetical protein